VGQPAPSGTMMNLAEAANLAETGHVFDHEPGYADYHHGYEHHDEYQEHAEFYGDARYPLFNLQAEGNPHLFPYDEYEQYGHFNTNQAQEVEAEFQRYHMNETESNLYHSWPAYTPVVSHDWQLKHNPHRVHDITAAEESQFGALNEIQEDSLDIIAGLRRMDFEGLKQADKDPPAVKAAVSH